MLVIIFFFKLLLGACTSDDMKVPMPTAPLRTDVEKEAEERAKLRTAEAESDEDNEKEEL